MYQAAQRWFVVCSQPHREKRAEAHLRQQGFGTFLPLYRKTVRHARQFRMVAAPLFPRYLFVRLDLHRDRWRSVHSTFGVSHLIMEGETPKPIRSDVIADLRMAADADDIIAFGPDLPRGGRVRFTNGPFAGLVGELLELDDAGRVRVLLEVLGNQVPVQAHGIGLVAAG